MEVARVARASKRSRVDFMVFLLFGLFMNAVAMRRVLSICRTEEGEIYSEEKRRNIFLKWE
jgi:hypothetical protein